MRQRVHDAQRKRYAQRESRAKRVDAVNQIERVDKTQKIKERQHGAECAQLQRSDLLKIQTAYHGHKRRGALHGKFYARAQRLKIVNDSKNKHTERGNKNRKRSEQCARARN